MNQSPVSPPSAFKKLLDFIEREGNKAPYPAILFLLLIVVVFVPLEEKRQTGVGVPSWSVEKRL